MNTIYDWVMTICYWVKTVLVHGLTHWLPASLTLMAIMPYGDTKVSLDYNQGIMGKCCMITWHEIAVANR